MAAGGKKVVTSGDSESRSSRIEREVIYRSPWVNLFVDRVRLPEGRIIDRFHVLDFVKQAVATVVQNASREILMVESYR